MSDDQAEEVIETPPETPAPAQVNAPTVTPLQDGLEALPSGKRQLSITNTMVQAVADEVEATIKYLDICKCDRCFSDMCAIVLNNIKPHYVTTAVGALYDKAALLNIVALSKISVEVFKAIEIVSKNPSHD